VSGKEFLTGLIEDCVSPRALHIGFGGKDGKADEKKETESIIKRALDMSNLTGFD
jgi:hypothetical protein